MRNSLKNITSLIMIPMMVFHIIPHGMMISSASSDELVYPLKTVSKLDCRFEDFENLSSACKQALPILHTKDYEKYAKLDGGYNEYTRFYTVLWGASYKYGWDVGNGGHQGTDIATAKGTPVYSIADGKVLEAGEAVGWGNHISIEHTINGKKVISNYAHLSSIGVKKGDSVKSGDEIGKVGSTGNSTGNHLHFQIDLPYDFHPYYYSWEECPYSYYNITETGVCFNVLAKYTVDPLAFLETNGAILDEVSSSNSTNNANTNSSSTNTSSASTADIDEIFDTTLYYEYGTASEIKALQKLMKYLGYYDGSRTGEYKDIESAVLDFQLEKGIISSASDDGAGWFGPKTRAVAKTEYNTYLAEKSDSRTVANTDTSSETKDTATVTKKVSRENMMTREEIEAKEMEQFLKIYTPEFKNGFSQIQTGETITSLFTISDARGKGFKGNTPGNVTFEFDETKLSIFPKSFYNFSDGTREIQVSGLAEGYTILKVKIGNVVVKTLTVTIGKKGAEQSVNSAKLFANTKVVLSDENTGLLVMKDSYNNSILKSRYSGTFTLKGGENTEFCIKKGNIEDIRKIYTRDCLDEEFVKNPSFTYDDTIGGILLFNYRVSGDSGSIKIEQSGKSLATATITSSIPKGLTQSYVYYDAVLQGLKSKIVSGINKGYFQEQSNLSQQDAKNWILALMKQESLSASQISELQKLSTSKFEYMSRLDFLSMIENSIGEIQTESQARIYKDLEEEREVQVASLLGSKFSFKDDFGEQYFQPDKKITRGEAAYILVTLQKRLQQKYLVLK